MRTQSRLAQLVERKTFNLVVVGSSPTVGAFLFLQILASGDLTARPLGAFRKICSCKFRSCSTLFSFLVKEIIFVLQADKSLRCMIMSSYEGDLWHFCQKMCNFFITERFTRLFRLFSLTEDDLTVNSPVTGED